MKTNTNPKSITFAVGIVLALAVMITGQQFGIGQAKAEGAESLTDGLISWWKLNDVSGTSAADSSTNNFSQTLVNTDNTNWSTDVPTCTATNSSSLLFNGTDQYASHAADEAALEPGGALSVSAWVRFDDADLSNIEAIAGNLLFGEGNFGYGLVAYNNWGELVFEVSNSSAVVEHTPVVGEWLHLTGTFDPDNDVVALYVHDSAGEFVTSSDTSSTDDSADYTYASRFHIGATDGEYNYLEGAVDDVRVYGRSLSAEEATELASVDCEEPVEEVAEDDNDGVEEEVEAAAPNSGDANNDGTPDSEQATVTSTVNPVNGDYVVLEAGGVCGSNDSVLLEKESTDEAKDDDGYDYPVGLLDFSLSGCSVGGTETITQYYYGDYDLDNLVARKYDKTTDTYTTIESAVLSVVTIGGESAVKVVYSVTDGGELDADGEANGTIVDPVGLGAKVLAETGAETYMLPIVGAALVATTIGLAYASRRKITQIKVRFL